MFLELTQLSFGAQVLTRYLPRLIWRCVSGPFRFVWIRTRCGRRSALPRRPRAARSFRCKGDDRIKLAAARPITEHAAPYRAAAAPLIRIAPTEVHSHGADRELARARMDHPRAATDCTGEFDRPAAWTHISARTRGMEIMREIEPTRQEILDALPPLLVTVRKYRRVRSSHLMTALGCLAKPANVYIVFAGMILRPTFERAKPQLSRRFTRNSIPQSVVLRPIVGPINVSPNGREHKRRAETSERRCLRPPVHRRAPLPRTRKAAPSMPVHLPYSISPSRLISLRL